LKLGQIKNKEAGLLKDRRRDVKNQTDLPERFPRDLV
jgi:hypothetical protein